MNEIVSKVFEGEVLGPKQTVRVVGRPKPLQEAIVDTQLPAGLTVDELLDLALGDKRSGFSMDYLVCVEGTPIPSEWRSRVRVRSGTVTFSPRLQKDALRSIALIAVAIIALVVAPIIAGALFAAGSTALTIATGIIGAGIVLGGTMAVNALFPAAPPSVSDTESSGRSNAFALTGASNTMDPFGPVPSVYGRMRVWPRFAAVPYTEYVGSDQYLRLLFCVGYGPLDIDDLKIGETDLDEFEDVDVEILEGYDDDNDPTLYPGQVFQDQLSVELEAGEDNERTTADNIDVIQVDISFPNGVYRVNQDTGKFEETRIGVDIDYRAVGSGTWLDLDSYDKEVKWKKPKTLGFTKKVTRGQYEVRVTKTSGDSEIPERIRDAVWVSLKGLRNEKPIFFHKPLALIALRIKASGQLNNVIDSFNCMATSRVNSWNGSSWDTDDPATWDNSRNPADIFRHILQGPAIYHPVDDEQIDLESLEGWHEYCDDEEWEYNREHDTRLTVFEALRMVAASGRARVVRTDGKWGVIWDDADVPVAQHFTPRNSWGFEETRVYFTPPHALRVNFINEEKGYQPDERRVYDDGYSASNATTFEAMEFPGCTNPDNIYRLARFQMAQSQLRPATYTLLTNWQALSCTVGSRVYVAHDVTLWGLAQGRVVSVAGDVITLDQEVVFELGTEYLVRFRQADGTSVLRTVKLPESIGATNTIELDADVVLPDPEVGDLVMFGEDVTGPAVLLRVLEIEWMPDLRARITLVDDAPGIADADSGDIPPFDSQITAPPNLFLRAPTAVQVREIVYIQEGAAYADAALSWQALAIDAVGFEVQMRNDGVDDPTFDPVDIVPTSELEIRIEDLTPGTYSFRVRTLYKNGSFSGWGTLNNVTFTGTLARPDDVSRFRISVLGDLATLTWDPIFGQAVSYYVIRHTPVTENPSWGSASILFERVTGSNVQVPAVNGTYFIKAFTLAGAESLNASSIVFSGQNIVILNAVETLEPQDFVPPWKGALDTVEVESGTDFLVLDGNDAVGRYWYGEIIDLGEVFTSRVSSLVLAYGEDPSNVMSSWETMLSVDNLAGSEAADWRVQLEVRFASEFETWDPANKTTGVTLSDSDLTMTYAPGDYGNAFATQSRDTGKYCFLALCVQNGSDRAIGIANASASLVVDDWPGFDDNSLGVYGDMSLWFDGNLEIAAPSPGEFWFPGTYILCAVDLDADLFWFKLFNAAGEGDWNNDPDADPETGVGGFDISVIHSGPIFPFGSAHQSGKITIDMSPDSTLIPEGFEKWEDDGWSDWRELIVSDITAKAFQFRLTLSSNNPAINVTVEMANVLVDMPDRIDQLGDLLIPNTGTTITFTTPFRELRTVVVTAIQDANSGDYAVVSNRTETSFDIIVKNSSNVGVTRTIDAIAAGYGRQVS